MSCLHSAEHSPINSHALSLTFLGTGAGRPVALRSCPATSLNFATHSWLIDCAEGTQRQMLSVTVPKMYKITRIFITSMHVDHVSGLVPLMSNMMFEPAYAGPPEDVRLRLYGPAGLRAFVRANLKANLLKLGGKYQVNELLTVADTPTSCHPDELHENEAPGEDVVAGEDGTWPQFLVSSKDANVSAALMVHEDATSLGYVFEEPEQPVTWRDYLDFLYTIPRGLLPADMGVVRQIVAGLLKSDPEAKLLSETALPTTRRGRKVVVLGDTSDASAITSLAQDADVLVHEATNAPLPFDNAQSEAQVVKIVLSHGHSTPRMAGTFAQRVNSQSLVLTHFGPKFGDCHMQYLRQQAAEVFHGRVETAYDLREFPIPPTIGTQTLDARLADKAQLANLNLFTLQIAEAVMLCLQKSVLQASPAGSSASSSPSTSSVAMPVEPSSQGAVFTGRRKKKWAYYWALQNSAASQPRV